MFSSKIDKHAMNETRFDFFNLVLVDVSSYILLMQHKFEVASPINRRWRTTSTYWPHPRLSKALETEKGLSMRSELGPELSFSRWGDFWV